MKQNGIVPTLETERLILRDLRESDAKEVFENWASDDEVSRYVRWSTHKQIEETKEYIRNEIKRCKNEDYYTWGIVLKQNKELIGAIAVFPSEDERHEVGYNISKKYWRNGYTTEALKRVMKYLINDLQMKRFRCSHAVLNPASGAVMRKVGFKYVKDACYEKFDGSEKFECKVYNLDIDKINLVKPSKEYENQAIEYKKEHFDNGERNIHACSKWVKTNDYDQWLKYLEKEAKKETVEENHAVATTFFGVRESDNKIVGMINIRHELINDFLRNYAGHIGYGIRPSQRRKGYATQMLQQALEYCKETLNLEKVMISCNRENEGSRRTILSAGGAFEKEYITEDGENVQIYWINLK